MCLAKANNVLESQEQEMMWWEVERDKKISNWLRKKQDDNKCKREVELGVEKRHCRKEGIDINVKGQAANRSLQTGMLGTFPTS